MPSNRSARKAAPRSRAEREKVMSGLKIDGLQKSCVQQRLLRVCVEAAGNRRPPRRLAQGQERGGQAGIVHPG
jgi:hypothetical protein